MKNALALALQEIFDHRFDSDRDRIDHRIEGNAIKPCIKAKGPPPTRRKPDTKPAEIKSKTDKFVAF